MGAALAAYGFRSDNAADAYAAWLMNAWQAAHGDFSDASRGKAHAVRAQAAQLLASIPEFRGASDAVKQEFAEAHLLHAALIGASANMVRNDPAAMRRFADAVRQGARGSGIDLDSITLTEQGIVAISETGSVAPGGPVLGEASGSATPDSTTEGRRLLIAGAAGLGALALIGTLALKQG